MKNGNEIAIDFGSVALEANCSAKAAKAQGRTTEMWRQFDVKDAALSILIITAQENDTYLSWQEMGARDVSLIVTFQHSTGWKTLHSFMHRLTIGAQRQVVARIGHPKASARIGNGQKEIAA